MNNDSKKFGTASLENNLYRNYLLNKYHVKFDGIRKSYNCEYGKFDSIDQLLEALVKAENGIEIEYRKKSFLSTICYPLEKIFGSSFHLKKYGTIVFSILVLIVFVVLIYINRVNISRTLTYFSNSLYSLSLSQADKSYQFSDYILSEDYISNDKNNIIQSITSIEEILLISEALPKKCEDYSTDLSGFKKSMNDRYSETIESKYNLLRNYGLNINELQQNLTISVDEYLEKFIRKNNLSEEKLKKLCNNLQGLNDNNLGLKDFFHTYILSINETDINGDDSGGNNNAFPTIQNRADRENENGRQLSNGISNSNNLPIESHSNEVTSTAYHVDFVKSFYSYLSKADGSRASRYLTPSLKNNPNFDPHNLENYFSSFSSPLTVDSITPSGNWNVKVEYHYSINNAPKNCSSDVHMVIYEGNLMIDAIFASC